MKVLHILDSIKYSGAEIMLKVAAPYFVEKGIELHALAIGVEKGEFASQLEEVGFIIHHRPATKELSYLFKQKSWFKRMGFDAIHIHPEKNFILQATACRLANITAVRTIHTHFGFNGLLKFRKRIERMIARSMNVQMVSISNSVHHHEFRTFKNESTRIYNWTDENRFSPSKEEKVLFREEFGYKPSDKVVLTIGSCQAVKRHDHILRAISLVEDPSIKYLQIGSGPDYEQEQKLAKELSVIEKVKFIPFSNTPEVAYNLADLFVMTSKYEGLSIASIEAMHCGLMPILYNVPGLSELLKDSDGNTVDKAGSLIEESPERLAQEISRMMKNDKLRIEKSNYVSNWVRTKFDRKDSLDQYIQLYQN